MGCQAVIGWAKGRIKSADYQHCIKIDGTSLTQFSKKHIGFPYYAMYSAWHTAALTVQLWWTWMTIQKIESQQKMAFVRKFSQLSSDQKTSYTVGKLLWFVDEEITHTGTGL